MQRLVACAVLQWLSMCTGIATCPTRDTHQNISVVNTNHGVNAYRVIDHLVKLAQEANCYKVILSCDDANVGFYERCSFKHKGACMVRSEFCFCEAC